MAIKNVLAEITALKERIKNMSVDELQACMSSVESGETLLVDLREIQEVVDLGTIPGAKHVARGMLEFWADPSGPITGSISKRMQRLWSSVLEVADRFMRPSR